MTKGVIEIDIKSDISEYVFELLEEEIRNLLEGNGISANIFDHRTGNSLQTRKGMMGKNENDMKDQKIMGELILGDNIWFNDDLGCRLHICGFTSDQIEELKRAKSVNLTLTDFIDEDMPGVSVCIKGRKENNGGIE